MLDRPRLMNPSSTSALDEQIGLLRNEAASSKEKG
jgi:hypothetical protein